MKSPVVSIFNRFTVIAALCALIASAVSVTPARAAAIVVNTNLDSRNPNDGFCSLREAIRAANTNTASGPVAGECAAGSGADTISFAGDYILTPLEARGPLPIIASPITINGNGMDKTIIQAHAAPDTASIRVFNVDSRGSLTLNRVTVRNGHCDTTCLFSASPDGGGIYNAGILTVRNSLITANSLNGGSGGGIASTGTLAVLNSIIDGNSSNAGVGGILSLGALRVTNSTISGNSGGGLENFGTGSVTRSRIRDNLGGGLANLGTLTVTDSTISGNTAPGDGGGILNAGTLTLIRSTLAGNSAGSFGGGLFQRSRAEGMVINSTFSGNTASTGGGIHNRSESNLTVTNSTIAGNTATGDGAAGGGIYKTDDVGIVTLKNTIVADSTAGGNCAGAITNGGNNLDSGATCGWDSNNNSLSNVDPNLGPLANNGGPTQTMALPDGSLAIDAGADAGCPARDQRLKPRPQRDHCDIGAYEAPTVTPFRSAGAADGWVLESSETSNQGGLLNATAATFIVGDHATNRQYRSILHFNTSLLPDNAMVSKVVLRVIRHSVAGTDPFTTHGKIVIDIREGAFSDAGTLQASDFQAAASQNVVGAITNHPTPAGWYLTSLKPAAFSFINLTGSTQLRLRFQLDDDNDEIADFIRFYSGDAGPGDGPILVVEYYVP